MIFKVIESLQKQIEWVKEFNDTSQKMVRDNRNIEAQGRDDVNIECDANEIYYRGEDQPMSDS